MRILCLHGKSQSGAIFRNKISGARRKLERTYELHFLDGPIVLDNEEATDASAIGRKEEPTATLPHLPLTYAWWLRNEQGQQLHVRQAFDYIQEQTKGQQYDAIIGFSQGGTVATALALTGIVPGVRAVVTAGAPYVKEVFEVAKELAEESESSSKNGKIAGEGSTYEIGLGVSKFHFAGERDAMIPVESTRTLSERGGSGILETHDQGHLFPTRAARVNGVLEFLEEALFVPTTTGA